MSWLSDGASSVIRASGNAWKWGTSLGGLAENDVSKFFENEFVNKADLRGSEIVTGLSGIPVVKDIIGGINGIEQLEDLYNRTGKTVAYPGSGTPGASGLGHALSGISRKIEEGTHDLFKFYSGVADDSSNMFEQMSHGWNQRRIGYIKT